MARRKNLRRLTPDEVLALRQLTESKGWHYLKDIAEEMADAIEGPIGSNETKDSRIVRGAVFRRGVRGMFDAVEESVQQPATLSQTERLLASLTNSQPQAVIKEII